MSNTKTVHTRRRSGNNSTFGSILVRALLPILVFIAFIGCWYVFVTWFRIPSIVLPTPWAVVTAGYANIKTLAYATAVTGLAALTGLLLSVLIGTGMAILFSQSKILRAAMYPYVIFLQTVPIVAIAPLLIIWSGNNFRTIVLITIIISVFPIVANVTAGLISIDRNWIDLFRLYSASKAQVLFKLRIPAAISHLIIGMRISCGLAVIGAIMGEFFVGNGTSYDGLGTLMTSWQSRQKTDALIAAVAASTLLGISFFSIVNLLSTTILRRWTSASGFESNIG